jgi:hypothetical protein
MTLKKRLERLERRGPNSTDASGLVPHTDAWLRFWINESVKPYLDPTAPRVRMSLEAYRAVTAQMRDWLARDAAGETIFAQE